MGGEAELPSEAVTRPVQSSSTPRWEADGRLTGKPPRQRAEAAEGALRCVLVELPTDAATCASAFAGAERAARAKTAAAETGRPTR